MRVSRVRLTAGPQFDRLDSSLILVYPLVRDSGTIKHVGMRVSRVGLTAKTALECWYLCNNRTKGSRGKMHC